MSDRKLGVLLVCFDGVKTAGKVHRSIDKEAKAGGDAVLDTTVLQVDSRQKATVHDPHRDIAGALAPALTWGLFGLLVGGITGLIIWAVIGALCGGLYARYFIHHASKAELMRIGRRLAPGSSALLTFAETSDATGLLRAAAAHTPALGSVASIADDLSTRVFAGRADPVEVPHGAVDRPPPMAESTVLNMILLRYRDPKAAHQIAARLAARGKDPSAPDIEMVVATDSNGRRHVSDPKLGVRATAQSSMISWAGFGLVCGGVTGAISGGDILGFFDGAVTTAVAWGIFGIFAGALFGLWAGRAISARRLKGIGRLLAPGTSALVAWAEGPLAPETLDAFAETGSQRLILRFNPVDHGALLEAA